MHTAARKLHSQRGASMLFALLVFFLCLLAGVAALTAAAANAGRYTHLVGEQQQYFSTASALELLQAALDDDKSAELRTVTVTYTEIEDWWYENTTAAGSDPTYSLHTEPRTPTLMYSTGTATYNYFHYLLLQNCVPDEWKAPYSGTWPSTTVPSDQPYNYTIQLDNTIAEDWAATLYPVHVTVKPVGTASDGSYTLEMDLTTEDGSAYPLHVVWTGEADVQTKTETEITGDMSAPTTPAGTTATSSGTRTTTTTLTCTLRWSAGNRTVMFG